VTSSASLVQQLDDRLEVAGHEIPGDLDTGRVGVDRLRGVGEGQSPQCAVDDLGAHGGKTCVNSSAVAVQRGEHRRDQA
jgi:hypothetical protein